MRPAPPIAMILAAGRGERMRPLTDSCPKPLLEAGGKPLIEHPIARLRQAGVSRLVINHAHLGHLIEARLGDGERYGVRIRYSPENPALETAGGLRHALPLLGSAPFLVCNGDVYCELDPAVLVQAAAQLPAHCLAHLVLVPNPEHHPLGDFALDPADGLRLRADNTSLPRFTYAGLGVFRPELFADLPDGQAAPLGPLLRSAMASGRVTGSLYTGYWLDVGTPQRLAQLDAHLRAQA